MYLKEDLNQSSINLSFTRLLKFLEIIQYTFIVLFLTVIICFIYNSIFINLKKKIKHGIEKRKINYGIEKRKIKKIHRLFLKFLLLFMHTCIIIILIYYIRKSSLFIPSLSKLIRPSFNEHTVNEYVFHIALFITFIELIPEYKNLFIGINNSLFSIKDNEILYMKL
jgi:hypothetical protein